MFKVFQYRLYPSTAQRQRLEDTLETCRRWYNQCLAERKTAYAERKEQVSRFEQQRQIKAYRATNPWAAQVYSHVLEVVVHNLDKAFQAFFRRIKAGDTPGYPRFKSRSRFHSFGFRALNDGYKISGRRLRMAGIGRVAVRWHRPLEGAIKMLRISRKAGKWYAAFACEVVAQPLPATGQAVGIDVGIRSLVTFSTGEQVPHPQWYRHGQCRLRVLHRRVNRRTLGGRNRQKAIGQLQRHHARIVNQRKDFLKKLVHSIVRRYDRIAVEALPITNMVKNRHLSKSIFDANWGYFVDHLTYKAAEAGRVVCRVAPAYTSKTCSGCGTRFEQLSLRDRWITCGCGVSLDRDHNAAINILNRAGQVRWALSSSLDGLAQESVGP